MVRVHVRWIVYDAVVCAPAPLIGGKRPGGLAAISDAQLVDGPCYGLVDGIFFDFGLGKGDFLGSEVFGHQPQQHALALTELLDGALIDADALPPGLLHGRSPP